MQLTARFNPAFHGTVAAVDSVYDVIVIDVGDVDIERVNSLVDTGGATMQLHPLFAAGIVTTPEYAVPPVPTLIMKAAVPLL